MTPSMPRPMTTSATITSMSVKPAARLLARIRNTLLALALFGRRLGLHDGLPVTQILQILALLDAQVAVGERCHSPQGRCAVALDLQLERHDVAARQYCELRRPLLVLIL